MNQEVRKRILLVDDNEDVRDVVSEQLIRGGYDVLQAKDTDAAACLFESNLSIDLLLTDFRLTEKKTGVELGFELRLSCPSLPVLILTGYAREAEEQACGQFTVLAKPISRENLLAAVKDALLRRF